jgi:hypothetical protein
MPTPEPILDTQLLVPAPVAHPVPLAPALTVGGIVGKTLRVWWKRVLPFTAMSVVVYSPIVAGLTVVWSLALRTQGEPEVPTLAVAVVGAVVVTIVLAVIQAGAVTYGTVRHLQGERAGLGEMLRVGVRRGLPVVGVGFLLSLAVVLALFLLVVPGILVMVATCVAIPAAVVERPGTIGAIRRSLALTRGSRWPLFAAGLAILFLGWSLGAVVQVGATVLCTTLLPAEQALTATLVASQLGNVLFAVLPLVGVAVAYHDLRVAKEGVDTVALARVFE